MRMIALLTALGALACNPFDTAKKKAQKLDTATTGEYAQHRLTEKEVKKFVKDLPKVGKELQGFGNALAGRTPNPLAGLAGLTISRALDARLRTLGYNPPERFFEVYVAVMTAYSAVMMQEMASEMGSQMEEGMAQMKKMLADPNVPESQKAQMREALKQSESQRTSMGEVLKDVPKRNITLVKRYQKEIEEAFGSLDAN